MRSIRKDLWPALGPRERKIERIDTQRITTFASNIYDLGLSVVLWKEASNRQRTSKRLTQMILSCSSIFTCMLSIAVYC